MNSNTSVAEALDRMAVAALTANEADRADLLFKAKKITIQVLHLEGCLAASGAGG